MLRDSIRSVETGYAKTITLQVFFNRMSSGHGSLKKKLAFTSYSAPTASKCLKIGIWEDVYVFFRCCKLKFLPGLSKVGLITGLSIPLFQKDNPFLDCLSDKVGYIPHLVDINRCILSLPYKL